VGQADVFFQVQGMKNELVVTTECPEIMSIATIK